MSFSISISDFINKNTSNKVSQSTLIDKFKNSKTIIIIDKDDDALVLNIDNVKIYSVKEVSVEKPQKTLDSSNQFKTQTDLREAQSSRCAVRSPKKCFCPIQTGPNRGKICGRKDCKIISHKTYFKRCRVFVGHYTCGELNCKKHKNISNFIELPDFFVEAEENFECGKQQKTIDYDYLVNMYNSYQNPISKNDFVENIKYLLDLVSSLYSKKLKSIITIFIWKILETESSKQHLKTKVFLKFKNTVYSKYKEFELEELTEFREYFINNFYDFSQWLQLD